MPHTNNRQAFLIKKRKKQTSFVSLSFQKLTSTKLHLHHNQMMEHHFTSAEKIDHITLYQCCHQHRCFLNVDRLPKTTRSYYRVILTERNTALRVLKGIISIPRKVILSQAWYTRLVRVGMVITVFLWHSCGPCGLVVFPRQHFPSNQVVSVIQFPREKKL